MEKPKFTKKVSAGTRLYYFDVHADRKGASYITISEIPTKKNPAMKEPKRLFVHREDFDKFAEAFIEAVNFAKTLANE